jgi:hypothetical protein
MMRSIQEEAIADIKQYTLPAYPRVIARDAVVLGCMSKGSGNPGVLHTSLDYPIKLDNDKK